MFRRAAAIAVIGLLVSGQAALAAGAARIGSVTGTVMVSKNGQLVPATAGMELNPGDRVIAGKGSARISYGENCSIRVPGRTMETVSATSPCAGGERTTTRVAADTSVPYRESDFWLFLGYGALTLATVGIALDDDEQPVSP